MVGNTERFTRVLLLWLDLHKAVSLARSSTCPGHRTTPVPWDAKDETVRDVWRKLTDPINLLALEQWLYQSAEGQPAEWAREALRVCRERSRGEDVAV